MKVFRRRSILKAEPLKKLKYLTDVIVYDKPISSVPFYLVSDLVLADTCSGAFAEGILTNSQLIGLHTRHNKAADFVNPIIFQIAPICENVEKLHDTVNRMMTSKSDDFHKIKDFLKKYLFTDLQG
jgi:hypothetical protein